jgi:putative SOS response-associated peptidase YedK
VASKYILGSRIDTIESHFNVISSNIRDWSGSSIVYPNDTALIVTQSNPGILSLSTFGMTPSWAKYPMQLFNARAEGDKNPNNDPAYRGSLSIFQKRAFQKPLFSQRCIVIADAFIESSIVGCRQPHLFYLIQKERPFGMAGLYDIWFDPVSGVQLLSFSIITVPANSLVRKIGAIRMPVILPRGKEARWLKPTNSLSDNLEMIKKFPSERMDAYPISEVINQPGPHEREILLPIGERLTQQAYEPPLPRQKHYRHKNKSEISHWRGNKPI